MKAPSYLRSSLQPLKIMVQDRLAVIGDGMSDEEAARIHGCVFIKIAEPSDLVTAARKLELTHV